MHGRALLLIFILGSLSVGQGTNGFTRDNWAWTRVMG